MKDSSKCIWSGALYMAGNRFGLSLKSDYSTYKRSTQIHLSVWKCQPPSPFADCLIPTCAHPEHVHDAAPDSGASLEVHSIASSSLHAGTDMQKVSELLYLTSSTIK